MPRSFVQVPALSAETIREWSMAVGHNGAAMVQVDDDERFEALAMQLSVLAAFAFATIATMGSSGMLNATPQEAARAIIEEVYSTAHRVASVKGGQS